MYQKCTDCPATYDNKRQEIPMIQTNIKLFSMGFAILAVIAGLSLGTGCEGIGTTHPPDKANLDEPQISSIIGGEETGGEAEWGGVIGLGFVMGGRKFTMCSGTLIHPRVVLTAGHCIKGQMGFDLSRSPGMLSILAGGDADTELSRAKRIVVHPHWDGELSDGSTDLALILLAKEINDVPHYPMRDFPTPQVGDDAFLVGYGDNGQGESGIQRKGSTKIVDLPTGLLQVLGESNICPGDSGGPVFTRQNGEWVVSGVNSFGAGDVCNLEVGMYAVNVLTACHWLNKVMLDFVEEDLGLEECRLCEQDTVCDWGRGCGPGLPDCPLGTTCIKPQDFSTGGYGYCAAPCCQLGEDEPNYCLDVAGGQEHCGYGEADGTNYCMISCNDDTDCPPATACKQRPFETEKICIATPESGAGAEIDTSNDEQDCSTPDDGEDDSDPTEDDTEEEDGGSDGGNYEAASGCGCRQIAGRVEHPALFHWLALLY